MRLAIFVEPGYPERRIRRWVSTLRANQVILLPTAPVDTGLSPEERLIYNLCCARGLAVQFLSPVADRPRAPSPLYEQAEGVVVLRDGRSRPLSGEREALSRNLPLAVIPARIWA